MATRRKRIKIELTQDQVNTLWPFFQAVMDDNLETDYAYRLAVFGQAWVKDEGAVRGWAQWVLLTPGETVAVQALLQQGFTEVADEIMRLRAALYTIACGLDVTPGHAPTLEDARAVAVDALGNG